MGYVGKIKDSSGTTHLVASTLFGTCSTAAETAKKVVTLSTTVDTIEEGVTIYVKFTYSNTNATPTLQVGNVTAANIYAYGTTKPGTTVQATWSAGSIVGFTYDGSAWIINNYKVSDINHNTDEKVKQTNDTSSNDYRVLLSNSANDNEETSGTKKSANLIFNPNTKTLTTSNGYFKLLNGINAVTYTKEEDSGDTKYPAKWYCSMEKTPADGDIVTITVPVEGGDNNGVYLSIEGNTSAKYNPISVSKTTKLTTHFNAEEIITLVYRATGSTDAIYPIDGGTATTTVSGGCWSVLNYYNTNTDTKVTQTNTTGNASYRILFSNTADNTSRTEAARKSTKLQFNPSTCTLQLYNESTTATNAPATILFSMKDTTTGKTYNGGYIKVYQDHGATPNGDNMVINSGGGMFLGSGESPSSHYSAKGSTYTGEDCFITADGSLHLQANGNTIANRKGLQITNGFALVPEQADVATDNVGSIGTSSYRWANGYFTKINGVTPALTDTTYTFEDGTNGFTVITNGSGVQAVTVTPSIVDNITGSGTSGYLAKFNGNNTITSGPQLGSDTTTYLRNDGTWTTPVDTKNTAGSNNSTSSLYLIGATSQTTGSNGVQTYSNSGLVYDGTSHTLKIGTGNEIGTIQLQAGNTVLYNTIIPGLNTQPISHTLPSSSGTLINNTDYNNNRELQIYESLDSTMGQDSISENITNIRDKIKYIDIFFTDNNFHKGWSGGLNIISENYGHLRIPYDQISKDPVSDSTRFSLFLFGDENSYYLRKRTYYVYETENSPGVYTLNIAASGNNKDLVIQFYGTPGTGSWGNMTVRAMYSIGIKIYRVKLILDL